MGEAGRPRGAAGGQPGAGAALPVPVPRSVLPPAQIPAWWRWRRGEPAGPAGREGHRARAAPALGFGIRRVSAAADGEWGPGGGGWGDFRGLPGVWGAPRGDVGSWGRVGAAWALPGAPRPCCGEGKPRTGRPQKVLGIRKQDPGCCCLREERGRGQGRLVPGCVHPHPAHWAQRDTGSALSLRLVLFCGWTPATVLVPGTRWLRQQQISSGSSSPNPAKQHPRAVPWLLAQCRKSKGKSRISEISVFVSFMGREARCGRPTV